MKMTRRNLLHSVAAATGAAATGAVATSPAQTPPPPAPATADPLKRGAEAIAKVALPQLTEPAFSFKA